MTFRSATLDSLGVIHTGSTPSTSVESFWGGELPFVTPAELDQREPIQVTPRTLTDSGAAQARVLKKDAVLVCCIGSLGKVGLAGRSLATNQQINAIEFDEKLVVPKYGFYACQRLKPTLMAMAPATTVPIVNKSKFGQLQIPLPPLPEQRRIASILDKADAIRIKRFEALALLDGLAQSIFCEMFGDPVANPMGWRTVPVGELLEEAEVFVDGDWVESKDQDPHGEVRLIQLADVGDGFYVNKSARFMNKKTAIRLRCTSLKTGDVLIARMPDPLGRACIFPGDSKECVTVVDVCIVRPSKRGPDPAWLMCCINTPSFRNQIAGEATGTTRTRISRGNLTKLPIIAPPFDLQRQFAHRYEAVLQQRAQMLLAADQMNALFSSLQNRAFNEGL